MSPYLSIVIPCYNEAQNIRLGALDKVAHYLHKQKYRWEVLIVDDGSSDESVDLIGQWVRENKNFRLIKRAHQGKAATVIGGIKEAQGTYVLFSDLDQATPLNQIEKLLPWFEKGFDVVIGSRQNRRIGAPFSRRLMGPGFMMVRNFILGLGGIEDTQCGFKAFKREVASKIFAKLSLYKIQKNISGPRVTAAFDVEVLFVAKKLGYIIKEIPVEWHYVDTRRVSPLLDSLDALLDIVRIKIKSLQGAYD